MSKGCKVWLGLTEWMVNYINKAENKSLDKDYFTADKWGTEINGIPTSTITKELQTLNIIKNKRVNVNQFLIRGADYNCCCRQGYELTTDEIYLLREVLCDDK